MLSLYADYIPISSISLSINSCSNVKVRFYLPAKFPDAPTALHTFCFIKKRSKLSEITMISLICEKDTLFTSNSGPVMNWCDSVAPFLNSGNSNFICYLCIFFTLATLYYMPPYCKEKPTAHFPLTKHIILTIPFFI